MTILYKEWKENKAQFKRLSFHVPNLIPPIKYMKRSMFESIKSDMSNLGRQMNEDRRLWRDFVSNVEHHMCPPPPRELLLGILGCVPPGPQFLKG